MSALAGSKKQAQLRYEKGERKPDSDYLFALYENGVDVLYLLTGKRCPTLLEVEEEILISGYRSLDARGRAGVIALVGGLARSPEPTTNMNFNGTIGQHVQGDVTFGDGASFNVGADDKTRKK
ncbi:MAG: helix-turn-helix domain-containing protein [Janthinobacterium lividum]